VNSAATECNFSNFGNIQTKKCSLLSVAKTHKTNVVCMDIHRCHASLGLLKTCSKQKLSDDDEPACTTDNVPSDAKDDDFEHLAQNLINMATADNAADAANEEEELLALPLVVVPHRAGHHTCTQIPITSLFDFTRSDNGLDFYWQGVIKGLCYGYRIFVDIFFYFLFPLFTSNKTQRDTYQISFLEFILNFVNIIYSQ
jgi:hypothetical protein